MIFRLKDKVNGLIKINTKLEQQTDDVREISLLRPNIDDLQKQRQDEVYMDAGLRLPTLGSEPLEFRSQPLPNKCGMLSEPLKLVKPQFHLVKWGFN